MGTILTGYGEAAYDHEGYASRVLTTGKVTGTWSAETDAQAKGELAPAYRCGRAGTGRWRVDPDSRFGIPDDDQEDEVLAAWRSEHAVPVLTAAADKARARLASRLRWLAEQVTAGERPSGWTAS